MNAQPIHILSPRVDPAGALEVLRKLASHVEVEGEPPQRWTQATIRDRRGLIRRHVSGVAFRHVPDYYTQPDFPEQTAEFVEFFVHGPVAALEPEIRDAIGRVRFTLAVEAEPDLDFDDARDPRLKIVYALARHLGGMLLTRDGLRDADGEILVSALPEPEPPEPVPPTAERVARRALALAAVAGRGLLEQEDPADAGVEQTRQRLNAWVNTVGLRDELEPDEEALLRQALGAPEHQESVNGCWRLEGLVVLAWALGKFELPAHDETVEPPALLRAMHILDAPAAKELVVSPQLHNAAEIAALRERLLAVHWRLREFRMRPEPIDFTRMRASEWFPLNLSGVPLVDNDLALREFTLSKAPEELFHLASSIAQERHLAANWLMGESDLYSETDTST